MKRLKSIVVATLLGAVASSASHAAPFFSATLEGSDLRWLNSSKVTYVRESGSDGDFWSFCRLTHCSESWRYAYLPEVQQQTASTESGKSLVDPWLLSGNATTWYFPHYVEYFQQSLGAATSDQTGRFFFSLTSDSLALAGIPDGMAVGLMATESTYSYVVRGAQGRPSSSVPLSFTVSSTFESAQVPEGYSIEVETLLMAMFSAGWDDGGEWASMNTIVYSEQFIGTGSRTLALSTDLDDYAVDPRASYGSLGIWATTLVRIVPNPVSEPPAPALAALGLAALVFRRRAARGR